jgi:hypothetical protein
MDSASTPDSPGDQLVTVLHEHGLADPLGMIEELIYGCDDFACDEHEDLLDAECRAADDLYDAYDCDKLQDLRDRFEAARDEADEAWERLDLAVRVLTGALGKAEDDSVAWTEGEGGYADPEVALGQDPEAAARYFEKQERRLAEAWEHVRRVDPSQDPPSMKHMMGARAARKPVRAARSPVRGARARGAGRPAGRSQSRSHSRGGDSGDSSGSSSGGDGDPPPPPGEDRPLAASSPRLSRPWRLSVDELIADLLRRAGIDPADSEGDGR